MSAENQRIVGCGKPTHFVSEVLKCRSRSYTPKMSHVCTRKQLKNNFLACLKVINEPIYEPIYEPISSY